jgi:peptidoglycan/xylan/chitin deacetylase (PgdA/CDA1 family)
MKTTLQNCIRASRKSRAMKGLRVPKVIASEVLHWASFNFERPIIQFDRALVIFSIDIDVGEKKLGLLNKGKNDSCVHKFYEESRVGEIEEQAIPLFVDLFNSRGIPVTFAVRGQLTEIDNKTFPLLLDSPVKHDIGGHGYTHKQFTDLSRKEAEIELEMLSVGFKKYGITPKSFVFPRNMVSHIDVLEQFGYDCYRDAGTLLNDGMFIKRNGRLYDIHPSIYLNQSVHLSMLKLFLKIAIRKRTILHLWFHPWNFGENVEQVRKNIDNILVPFVDYAKNREESQMLKFETMYSAAKKADANLRVEKIQVPPQ